MRPEKQFNEITASTHECIRVMLLNLILLASILKYNRYSQTFAVLLCTEKRGKLSCKPFDLFIMQITVLYRCTLERLNMLE